MYKIFFIVLTIVIFSPLYFLNAQDAGKTYEPLIKLSPSSGLAGVEQLNSGDLNEFIAGAFKFGVSIAIILAVIMVIWGGVEYMTSESPFMKGEGKARIGAAIGGLILALSTIVIFNTIDPNIANKNFAIKNLVSDLKVGIGEFDANVIKPPVLVTDSKTGEKGWDVDGDGKPDYTHDTSGALGNIMSNNTGTYTNANDIYNATTNLGNGDIRVDAKPKIDTDGISLAPFSEIDPKTGKSTHQSQTAYLNGILDANKHHYVVVPISSPIPNGTPVTIYNTTANKMVRGFVGDRGPEGKHGEVSTKMAYDLGVWDYNMKNAARQHNLVIIYHTNQPKITASNVF